MFTQDIVIFVGQELYKACEFSGGKIETFALNKLNELPEKKELR